MIALREAEPVDAAAADQAITEALEEEALDAYSTAVSTAAARLIPSVASLRVERRGGGWGVAAICIGGGEATAVAIERAA